MKYNLDVDNLPKHIGFIMDGNGRWATKRHLPRKFGHREGVKVIKKIADAVYSFGIFNMSIYAFSTENWNRPQDEIDAIFDLLRNNLKSMLSGIIKKQIKVIFMGDISYFPEDVRIIIQDVMSSSKDGSKGILNIGLNYGSRAEIISAVNLAVSNGQNVDEKTFADLLYTKGLPDLDLLVRTSGEMRLSNFMLYQAAYAELFFTETLWPDFNKDELYQILQAYAKRNRRFGKI